MKGGFFFFFSPDLSNSFVIKNNDVRINNLLVIKCILGREIRELTFNEYVPLQALRGASGSQYFSSQGLL